jgi:hypothetical protein
MVEFDWEQRKRGLVLVSLLLAISFLSGACGSSHPTAADPLPQGTSSTSSSCTNPCGSTSTLYSDVSSVFDPLQIGAVRDADQFPGGDFSAKVNAAIADLPAEGGTVDARNFSGQQTVSSSIILNKDVCLLLPPVHIIISGAPLVIFAADGSELIGGGNENSELIRLDAGDVVTTDTSRRIADFRIKNLTLGAMQQSTTKSAALDIENAVHVYVSNIIVHGGYYGVLFSGTAWVSLRDFYIDTSAVAGLFFAERQNTNFVSTEGGYVANGQMENNLGNGVDIEGFVDRIAFLHLDSEVSGGEGFRINSNGTGIDSGKAGFERFFSCYASNNKGTGFDIKSNDNKFFDVYAEGGSGPGFAISGAANDFFYAEANGFAGGGFQVSGPSNRFYSITVNGSSDGIDFLHGSDESAVLSGDIHNNSGVGIDVQANDISLYNVKQSLNAGGNFAGTGTLKRAIGNDGIQDLLGPSLTLGESGPSVTQGSSQTPPPGPCTPGSVYLVTVPSPVNMYVCQGTPTAAWVAK